MIEEENCSTRRDWIENYPSKENEMNKELQELYPKFLEDFLTYANVNNVQSNKQLAKPFLIYVPDSYINSKTKIMFVGKQTNGWLDKNDSNDGFPDQHQDQITVEKLQALYDEYVNRCDYNLRSPYWRLYRDISATVNENGIGIIANNIAKVSFTHGQKGYDDAAVKSLKDLLKKELMICKPNIVYFVTGPSYDELISATLGPFELEDVLGIGADKVARLNFHSQAYKDIVMYRTYGPFYLNSARKEPWCKRIYEEIFHLKI